MSVHDGDLGETFYVAADGDGALTWCQAVRDTAPSSMTVVLGGETQGPEECTWTTADGVSVWVHGIGISSRAFCAAFGDGLAVY